MATLLNLSTRKLVHDVSTRVQHSKTNLDTLQGLMGAFSHTAMVTRKSSRGGNLLVMADVNESIRRQYTLVSNTGHKIHQLVEVCVCKSVSYVCCMSKIPHCSQRARTVHKYLSLIKHKNDVVKQNPGLHWLDKQKVL